MKQCDCIKQTKERLKEKFGVECNIDNLELLSGRTFSTFSYEKTVGKRKKQETIFVLHTFCPTCGKPYKKEEEKKSE